MTFGRLRQLCLELLHFGWIGALNTLATFGLFHLLLFVMNYGWSYALSFAAGIPFSFILNSHITFRQRVDWRRMPAFAIVQGLSFGLGLFVLAVLVEYVGMGPRPASFLQLAITTPIGFLLARAVLARQQETA